MLRYTKLIGYSFLIYFFFAHFTPFVVQFFPKWQAYVKTADEYGIEPGALYYTDVPVVSDSERANRRAVMNAYGSMLGWKSFSNEDDKNTNESSKNTNESSENNDKNDKKPHEQISE